MLEELKEIVYDYLGDDSIEITEESRFVEDIGLSSLDLVSIVGDVEDTFGVEIADSDAPHLRTVGELMQYLKERQ